MKTNNYKNGIYQGVTYIMFYDKSKVENPATKDDIMFSVFKGTDGVTDKMYEEVEQFAETVKLREAQKKKEKK